MPRYVICNLCCAALLVCNVNLHTSCHKGHNVRICIVAIHLYDKLFEEEGAIGKQIS